MSFLRGMRNYKRLSQKTLGQKVGSSQQWMSLVERGQLVPSRQKMIELAYALGTSRETLMMETGK